MPAQAVNLICQPPVSKPPHGMNVPPLTSKIAPVINAAPSDTRNETIEATSSGSPYRPNGILLVKASRTARAVCIDIGVVTGPGVTQLTVMFEGAASNATIRVRPIMPALDEA